MQAKSSTPKHPAIDGLAAISASLEKRGAGAPPATGAPDKLELRALSELRTAHLNLSLEVRTAINPQVPAEVRTQIATTIAPQLALLGKYAEAIAKSSTSLPLFIQANHASASTQKLLSAMQTRGHTVDTHAFSTKLRPDVAPFDSQLPQEPLLPALKIAALEHLPSQAPETVESTGIFIDHQRNYVLGPELTKHQGSFGRMFRIERLEGNRSDHLLVKVQSSVDELFSGSTEDTTKTISQDLQTMVARAAGAQQSISRIENLFAAKASLTANPQGPLRSLGFEQGSVRVIDHFVDIFGKYYQVMHAMSGDLVDLSQSTLSLQHSSADGAQLARDVRLSVATQSILQLGAMHERHLLSRSDFGTMHNDVKLSNMVFNRRGSVRLIDFDEVADLSFFGRSKERFKKVGTLTSPEMELKKLRHPSGHLNAAHDVFAWGASMLDFALGKGRNQLFLLGGLGGKSDGTPGLAMASFVAWFEQEIAPRKTLQFPLSLPQQQTAMRMAQRSVALMDPSDKLVAKELVSEVMGYARHYVEMFNARGAQDPRLTGLILRSALHPYPQQRMGANKLAKRLLKEVANMDDTRRAAVVRHMDESGAATEVDG